MSTPVDDVASCRQEDIGFMRDNVCNDGSFVSSRGFTVSSEGVIPIEDILIRSR
jgi:hypothetical protein